MTPSHPSADAVTVPRHLAIAALELAKRQLGDSEMESGCFLRHVLSIATLPLVAVTKTTTATSGLVEDLVALTQQRNYDYTEWRVVVVDNRLRVTAQGLPDGAIPADVEHAIAGLSDAHATLRKAEALARGLLNRIRDGLLSFGVDDPLEIRNLLPDGVTVRLDLTQDLIDLAVQGFDFAGKMGDLFLQVCDGRLRIGHGAVPVASGSGTAERADGAHTLVVRLDIGPVLRDIAALSEIAERVEEWRKIGPHAIIIDIHGSVPGSEGSDKSSLAAGTCQGRRFSMIDGDAGKSAPVNGGAA
jgi:hypothetical protein